MDNQEDQKRPNIIWIFGDQHRAQALGCNGNKNVNTPNIDRMAENGINFKNAIAGFPLCCPFRGSLLTGKYPHDCVPGHEYRMPPSYPTIATYLNANGYHTSYFGKWHVDGFHESNGRAAFHIVPPERRGDFKEWIGYENNNRQWDSWVHGGDGAETFHKKLPGYETDCLTDYLLDYLKGREDKRDPFFSVLSVQPPHNPYYAPEENMERYYKDDYLLDPIDLDLRDNVPNVQRIKKQAAKDLAGYYAIIENLDWNVGRILDYLEESGLGDNTYVFFFSDHGDMHGSHGQFRKTTPYEESLRIPFIVGGGALERSEISIDGSRTCDALINHVDIPCTTLGLAGIEVPESMRGHDYSRVITRSTEQVISRSDEPDTAFIQSVIPTGHIHCVDKPWRGIVTKDGWKYACFNNCDWMMFNLNEDPYELVNLAHNAEFKEKRHELRKKLREWIVKTNDSFLVPIPCTYD